MKILAIGDFHGKFPGRLYRLAKEADLILSAGDFFPWSMKKIFFKHCYKKEKYLWDIIGKKKYKELTLKDLARGESKVIKPMNDLGNKAITTIGNYDSTNTNDQYNEEKWNKKWGWAEQDFLAKILKKYKNIRRTDYKFTRAGGLVIIGGFGHSSPGDEKSTAFKKHKKVLENLFRKFKKENKEGKVIFIFHNMPFNTKLDIISRKAAKEARGKHFGSKLTRQIIDRFHPILAIGGHMHENQGKCRIGRTLVVNPGAAVDGKAAIIDFDEKKKKVLSVDFIR
jgi:Icc-related predicted phosphoesterase